MTRKEQAARIDTHLGLAEARALVAALAKAIVVAEETRS
jgi:hypothetical protein